MPPQKTTRRPASAQDRPARKASPAPSDAAESMGASVDQAWGLWTRYAREAGDTVTDFLRRFGEEQQKSYEAWAANLSDVMGPKARPTGAEAARERLEEWNRQAEVLGAKVREAFEATLKPHWDLLELWAKPFVPAGAAPAEQTREAVGLVQKLWSGLTSDLARRLIDAMRPEEGYEEFLQAQDEVAKQFTENFQKLVRIYFTSPAFVTTFGKTLDNSLDLQRTWKDSDELFRRVTGLPTRREIGELNQAVRDLSEQVSRLNGKRP